jgi:hypothetical protein
MINKISDKLIKTRLDIQFVSKQHFKQRLLNSEWQLLEITWSFLYNQKHILFSTHLTKLNFKKKYQCVLDRNKKIIIYGDWRLLTPYYRFLTNKGFNVYLIK